MGVHGLAIATRTFPALGSGRASILRDRAAAGAVVDFGSTFHQKSERIVSISTFLMPKRWSQKGTTIKAPIRSSPRRAGRGSSPAAQAMTERRRAGGRCSEELGGHPPHSAPTMFAITVRPKEESKPCPDRSAGAGGVWTRRRVGLAQNRDTSSCIRQSLSFSSKVAHRVLLPSVRVHQTIDKAGQRPWVVGAGCSIAGLARSF